MTTSARVIVCGLLLLFAAAPSPAKANEVFAFAYLTLDSDPHYRPHRAYTGLSLRDRHPPLDGARTALRESKVVGRSLDLKFELVERRLASDEDVVQVIEDLAAEQARVFILDLPLELIQQAARALAERDLILFNVRHRDDALRTAACSPVLFHTIPSHAMLMDGLAQYLAKKNWGDVIVLEGETPADKTISRAFQDSASKFGLTIVEARSFVLSNDPRLRDQTNIPIMTADHDYDVIFLADTTGEVGRYVPYRTYQPRPVVGSEGLVASPWHWTWERHGAPQLNQRFGKRAKRRMSGEDWAAWAAVKSIVEAIVRSKSTDIGSLRGFLRSDDLTLDTYKGTPGNFRPWNNQLRQPVLLHTHNAVVARAPIDGFLHEKNNLDTLGADARDSACRM